MYNYNKELVKELDTILPTYYELFVDSSTQTPCITYLELNNIADLEGETLRYSNIAYRVKVWGTADDDLYPYTSLLDNKMFELGFKRRAYNELWID
jgi:hypothetical protein